MSTFTFTVRRRDLAWSVALIMVLSAIWVGRADLAGAGAPEGTGVPRVYIASGVNFPDALGVGPAAALHGAPIILVPTNPPLDNATNAELVRLDPQAVIIIGGTSAVSQATEDALNALLPNADVTRISATNRYKTNAAISALTFPVEASASLPAAAFNGATPAADNVTRDLNRAYNDPGGFLMAPIQLPDGATIIQLTGLAFDDDGGTVTITLYRQALTAESIAVASTSGDPGEITITSPGVTAGREVVDNNNYAYFVGISGANGPRFIRFVRVKYQLGAVG